MSSVVSLRRRFRKHAAHFLRTHEYPCFSRKSSGFLLQNDPHSTPVDQKYRTHQQVRAVRQGSVERLSSCHGVRRSRKDCRGCSFASASHRLLRTDVHQSGKTNLHVLGCVEVRVYVHMLDVKLKAAFSIYSTSNAPPSHLTREESLTSIVQQIPAPLIQEIAL